MNRAKLEHFEANDPIGRWAVTCDGTVSARALRTEGNAMRFAVTFVSDDGEPAAQIVMEPAAAKGLLDQLIKAIAFALVVVVLAACGDDSSAELAGSDGGRQVAEDSGDGRSEALAGSQAPEPELDAAADAAPEPEIDAGAPDAGELDAGPVDAGASADAAAPEPELDAGPPDAGEFDAGPVDAAADAGPDGGLTWCEFTNTCDAGPVLPVCAGAYASKCVSGCASVCSTGATLADLVCCAQHPTLAPLCRCAP